MKCRGDSQSVVGMGWLAVLLTTTVVAVVAAHTTVPSRRVISIHRVKEIILCGCSDVSATSPVLDCLLILLSRGSFHVNRTRASRKYEQLI